jgi:hypothetical protein
MNKQHRIAAEVPPDVKKKQNARASWLWWA